jgi:hypothetical protein
LAKKVESGAYGTGSDGFPAANQSGYVSGLLGIDVAGETALQTLGLFLPIGIRQLAFLREDG